MDKDQIPEINIDIELSSIDASEMKGTAFERIKRAINTSNRAVISVEDGDEPFYYCITPELYQELDDYLENKVLAKMANKRNGGPTIKVSMNDL